MCSMESLNKKLTQSGKQWCLKQKVVMRMLTFICVAKKKYTESALLLLPEISVSAAVSLVS